jgi:hypothetical protein
VKLKYVVAAVLVCLPVVAQAPADTDWEKLGAQWWAHVQYLADDKLQGRLPGTPGFELATQYVVEQFKAIGLKPAGGDGYLQPVKLESLRVDAAKSSVFVDAAGRKTELKVGPEIVLSPHVTPGPAVDAPLVFIGYGLRLPSKRMED